MNRRNFRFGEMVVFTKLSCNCVVKNHVLQLRGKESTRTKAICDLCLVWEGLVKDLTQRSI